MSVTIDEILSQPAVWTRSLESVSHAADLLRRDGERMLVIGCGTSAFVADSFSYLRELGGFGETDAAFASEPQRGRPYDSIVAITRSGTTTEVLDALASAPEGVTKIVVTGVADSPAALQADAVLLLDFADESSVVQTRFPTTFLFLARAALGEDVSELPAAAERALAEAGPLNSSHASHFVYLGTGWTYGLAQEAALKIREAAQAWAESYPLLDYRHGPLAVASDSSLVWSLGPIDRDLSDDIARTGARVVSGAPRDPLIELVLAQRLATEVAHERGLNPDAPRHLTRSIILK